MGGEGSSDAVVCPKPRWLGRRRRREACSNEIEGFDYGATADVLDKFLSKGSDWENNQAAAEASHFFGSPPRRSSNPIIHDACFSDGRLLAPLHPPSLPSNLMPSPWATSVSAVRTIHPHPPKMASNLPPRGSRVSIVSRKIAATSVPYHESSPEAG